MTRSTPIGTSQVLPHIARIVRRQSSAPTVPQGDVGSWVLVRLGEPRTPNLHSPGALASPKSVGVSCGSPLPQQNVPLSRRIGMAYQNDSQRIQYQETMGPRLVELGWFEQRGGVPPQTPDVRVMVIDVFAVPNGQPELERCAHARGVCDIVTTLAPGCELYVLPINNFGESCPEGLPEQSYAFARSMMATAMQRYGEKQRFHYPFSYESVDAFAEQCAQYAIAMTALKTLLLEQAMRDLPKDDGRFTMVTMSFGANAAFMVNTAMGNLFSFGAASPDFISEVRARANALAETERRGASLESNAPVVLSHAIHNALAKHKVLLGMTQQHWSNVLAAGKSRKLLVFEAAGNERAEAVAYGYPKDARQFTAGFGQFSVAAAQAKDDGSMWLAPYSSWGTHAAHAVNFADFGSNGPGAGTSTATPVLAASAAQIAQVLGPSATPQHVEQILDDIAHDIPGERDGAGVIHPDNAWHAARAWRKAQQEK